MMAWPYPKMFRNFTSESLRVLHLTWVVLFRNWNMEKDWFRRLFKWGQKKRYLTVRTVIYWKCLIYMTHNNLIRVVMSI
jgi:hypothetical protein